MQVMQSHNVSDVGVIICSSAFEYLRRVECAAA